MSAPQELKPFDGATHAVVHRDGEKSRIAQYVKITHWQKDGDHPQVSRYPIERREFKGLLRVGPKDKVALRFGEYIIEDEEGKIWTVASLDTIKYVPLEEAGGLSLGSIVVAALAIAIALYTGGGEHGVYLFAVTHLMYYTILLSQWNGGTNSVLDLDEANDDMRLSAHTNTYSVNQDTNDFWNDVTNEVTGTNYTAGGAALASQLLTRSTNTVTFDANDVVWTQSGAGFSTGRKFVLYRFNATAANAPLFSVITADADVGNVTGDLTIQFNASGIATWTTT